MKQVKSGAEQMMDVFKKAGATVTHRSGSILPNVIRPTVLDGIYDAKESKQRRANSTADKGSRKRVRAKSKR